VDKVNLNSPIEKLPLVGPSSAKRLEKLGIKTIEDLLNHFPFRYDDFSLISQISQIQPGETVSIIGQVTKIVNLFSKTGKRIQEATIADKSGEIKCLWFNQPYLVKTFKKNQLYFFSGKVESSGKQKVLMSPEYEIFSAHPLHTGRLVPVYNETYGISSKWLRSRIKYALDQVSSQITDFLPEEIIQKENLIPEREAIKQVHFPDNKTLANQAKYRLAFDELFLIQLSALIRKKEWQGKTLAKQFFIDLEKSLSFLDHLPFKLTNAQKRCAKEILLDLQKTTPMNRLLQGDVGSGKTVVAALAAYTAFLNHSDTLFMAPTEILAQQHYQTLTNLLEPFGVPIELITQSTKSKKKISQESPTPKVIVGTHALLYQNFNPEKIGLVIIDEQHRFGVEQRKLLSQKGKAPHLLTMTATPIPRTVALTMYNDLDLSVIDEMPPGRIKVKTWVVPPEKREKAYEWIRSQIKNTPQQAFIICPFIEESESLKTVKAATSEFETLSQKIFPDLKLGLVHGKMKSQEKEKALTLFREGKLDILVATPVVEVGIDIPNATIMMIEGADRFGLAQLHQLRGRVGRGQLPSFCLLFSSDNSFSSIKRLKNLETIDNGLALAEIDLKIRGPGEIYGTKQHGFPDLRVASFTDLNLIQKTRQAALQITKNHSQFLKNNSALKSKLEKYKIIGITN